MWTEDTKLDDTYTLVEELGSGGGGVVYKAYHERLQTYVVVKKVKDRVKGILDSRAEADILKRIKHTYLPRVYDFLEIEGEVYTVMDYIPGMSLDKVIAQYGRYPQKQVLKWAVQLAEALDYLHSQNPPIIHSDIKPANIMLTPEGNICLIDFNISLAFDSSMKTATGISGGYSPPEQYRDCMAYRRYVSTHEVYEDTVTMTGASSTVYAADKTELAGNSAERTESIVETVIGRGVDERSDIYSLGATLYHLLTGIRPKNDFEKIVPIDQCDVELSEGFAHILKKMMEYLPESRYQNGGQLLYAFQHIHQLDTEYLNYIKRRRRKKGFIAALYLTGGVVLGAGWGILQTAKNTEYNRSVAQAGEDMDAGNFEDAALCLNAAMEIRPKRMEAYSMETLRLYRQGDYEDCIRYAVDILQNPMYQMDVSSEKDRSCLGDIYYVLGNCYIEQEDYSNAELNLRHAVEHYDQNSLYYRDYAIALAKQGKIQEAEDALEKAVDLHLGEDSIYMVQGEISYAKNEFEDAESHLLRAIATAEEDSLRKRAVLLCDRIYREWGTDSIDQEIQLLEQEENRAGGAASSLSLSERLADAYARKAESDESVRQEYYEKAIAKFEFLYMNGYSTRQMMENIAILYEQMNEYDSAEEILMQMLEKYPDSYEGYKRLAYLEADRQQMKENEDRDYWQMKAYYDKAMELYGDREDDQEMQMLTSLISDLKSGNWL